MKKNLTVKETVLISSLLFGMFFGAGNLMFPAGIGKDAGCNMWVAFIGVFITAVGLPLLAVMALSVSRTGGVYELSSKVGRIYGMVFTTLLYMTIGPLFALPRCASTAFSVGVSSLPPQMDSRLILLIFSFVFFVFVLIFALKPQHVLTSIGRIFNPLFLAFLLVLVITALITPITGISSLNPSEAYKDVGPAFFAGFLEGYNTLDALAGLAFGILVINMVKKHGIEEEENIAKNTTRVGVISCLLMGVLYFLIALITSQSSPICADCADGISALRAISEHYFGNFGMPLITVIVILACFKTAIGLMTCCAEAFVRMFPKGPGYSFWIVLFAVISFVVTNAGLSIITDFCVPLLMLLYPLAISLIFLAIFGKYYDQSHTVYVWTILFAIPPAILNCCTSLADVLQSKGVTDTHVFDAMTEFANMYLPFFDIGLGWLFPTIIGCTVGVVVHLASKENKNLTK